MTSLPPNDSLAPSQLQRAWTTPIVSTTNPQQRGSGGGGGGVSHSSLYIENKRYTVHSNHAADGSGSSHTTFSTVTSRKPLLSSWWLPEGHEPPPPLAAAKPNDDDAPLPAAATADNNDDDDDDDDDTNNSIIVSEEEHDEQLTNVIALVSDRTQDANTVLGVVLGHMEGYERVRSQTEALCRQEQMALVEEMERRARAISEKYDAIKLPMDQRLHEFRAPVAELLEGKYVRVYASCLEVYKVCGADASSSMVETVRSPLDAGGEPDFLKFVDRIRDQRRRDAERRKVRLRREADRKMAAKREETERMKRADMAVSSVLPIFGQLALEEAMEALRRNGDDVNRTLDFIMSKDEFELYTLLAPPPTPTPTASAVPAIATTVIPSRNDELVEDPGRRELHTGAGAAGDDEKMSPAALIRQKSGLSTVLLLVSAVRDDDMVEYQLVMDRNRIPCDFKTWERHTIPLRFLLDATTSGFSVLSADDARQLERDRVDRVVKVWYQLVNNGDEFCPIKIVPSVPLNEYTLEWNASAGALRKMEHRQDGPVLFRATLDQGDGFGVHDDVSTPIELYTEVISAGVHNVVHMHLDDTRDDVSLDVVNLTNTTRTLNDCMLFEKDVSGRSLTYRIVVDDQQVVAVLYTLGDDVRPAFFVEHPVPSCGSMVTLAHGVLARVRTIPVGLIIASSGGGGDNVDDFDPQSRDACTYARGGVCQRKHPAELSGHVDVEVVMTDGRLLEVPECRCVLVCDIRTASSQQMDEYAAAVHSLQQAVANEYTMKLDLIEKATRSTTSAAAAPVMSVGDLNDVRQEVLRLREELGDTHPCVDDARMTRAFNGLRVFATEVRLRNQKH